MAALKKGDKVRISPHNIFRLKPHLEYFNENRLEADKWTYDDVFVITHLTGGSESVVYTNPHTRPGFVARWLPASEAETLNTQPVPDYTFRRPANG